MLARLVREPSLPRSPRGVSEAWIGVIVGTDLMLAFDYAGKTGAREAWIGSTIGTDVMLAFGYAGKTGTRTESAPIPSWCIGSMDWRHHWH